MCSTREKSAPGLYIILLIILALALSSETYAARDFSKPVDYKPLFVKDIKPEIVSLERLQKGLSVIYYLEYFERSLNSLPEGQSASYIIKKGKPITELNHQFGQDEVFDSGTNRGVAMRMNGYIVFDKEGEYQLQALSNDGVVVMVGGQTLISDPEQHSDRLSNIGHISIDQPGHYPTLIEYFQRKGTAVLKLLWKTPGSSDFVPIPANAYAHLP